MGEKQVKIITAFSALVCFAWIFGLGWVVKDYFVESAAAPVVKSSAAETVEIEDDGAFHILALGDSLTRGTGDSAGKGYVGYLTDDLKERSNQNVLLHNLGIQGLTSQELAGQVTEKEVQRQARQADVILITIGGNDLFRGGQALIDLDLESVKEAEEAYTKNLNTILSQLRSLNSEATIFLLGLYNPFIQLSDAKTISKIVRDWNYNSANVSAKYDKTVFVPTFDLFQLNTDSYLYTDKFHPNTEGYRLMAQRIASLISW